MAVFSPRFGDQLHRTGMNCKENDLAFIKQSVQPKNIGLIVNCSKYLGFYLQGDYLEISGEFWMAAVSDNYWLIESPTGSIETMYGKSKMAYIPDTWLFPIKEEPKEENISTISTLDDEIVVQ